MGEKAGSKPDKPSQKPPSRLGVGAAFAGTVGAFLLGQVFGGAFAWLLMSLATIWLLVDPDPTAVQAVAVVMSGAFTLLVLWLVMRRLRVGRQVLGLSRKPKWLDAGYTLAGAPVYFMMLVVVGGLAAAFFGVNLDQEQEIGFERVVSNADMMLAFVSLVVVPPIVEEVLFRGFLFTGLRTKFGFATTALIVSLLFALPHALASSEGFLWVAVIDTFVLSLVLCYLREKTGALWAAVALHAIKNGAAFVFLFVVV